MDSSSSVSGAQNQANTQSKAKSAAETADLNFNSFLQLLTVQLQHQDPLNPMDSTQFTQQIATFSGLEQQIQTNAHLEELVNERTYGTQTLAVNFIGKEVLGIGDTATLQDGKYEFQYSLADDAAVSKIEIYDPATGEVMKTVQAETKAGQYEYTWDGKMDDGEEAPEGTYAMKFTAFTADGDAIDKNTYVYQKVTGVESSTDGDTYLVLANGERLLVGDAFSVRNPADNNV